MENNEQMNQNQNQNQEDMSPEQILVKMRETMVPREEADEWRQKYNQLFREVATRTFEPGQEANAPSEAEKEAAFRKAISDIHNHKDMGARSVMQKLLTIDAYQTEHGQRSIFAPSRGNLDSQAAESCNRVREAMQFIVDTTETDAEAQTKLSSRILS